MAHLLTRRRLLKTCTLAGIGVATLAPLSGFAKSAAPVAICDRRSEGYQDFVSECRNKGIEVVTITHDVDTAWRLIRSRWRDRPFPLIGLTRPSALTVFSELGRANGMRLGSKEGSAHWVSWTLVPGGRRL